MLRTISLALLFLLLVGCGSAQTRPDIVGTWPAQQQILPGFAREVRVTYSEPVSILTPEDAVAYTGGYQIPLVARIDPQDRLSVLLAPATGFRFGMGATSVVLGPGFVVNADSHYRLEEYSLNFTQGDEFDLFLAVPAPASVVALDTEAYTPVADTPTPGGRIPLAVSGSAIGTENQMWVQLADGGGAGNALAYFEPGAASMNEVPLSFEPGGDLVVGLPALRLGSTGRMMFAAYRDTALGQARLCAVDVETKTEAWSLVLSPPASPTTRPLGLVCSYAAPTIDITVGTDSGDYLVRVNRNTRVEIDLDPGVAVGGLPLTDAGGPVGGYYDYRFIAPLGRTTCDLTIVTPSTGVQTPSPSVVGGIPDALFTTIDGHWVYQGLRDYNGDLALGIRHYTSGYHLVDPVAVVADAGASNPPATAVRSILNYPGIARIAVLFDNSIVTVHSYVNSAWEQEDLDSTLLGIQGVDVSASAPDATAITLLPPALAPAP